MFNIGCHLSVSKGYYAMGEDAIKINANTFQFFTRNPRGGGAKNIDAKDAQALSQLVEKEHFAPLLAHAPYTLNLCSANPGIRKFSRDMMSDDLSRLAQLPCHLYNFHPGSATGQEKTTAIKQIADALNSIITKDQTIMILLETMSGKGSEIGSTFEELKQILDEVELSEKMGICIDTCHIYDAGYDIVNDLDGVLTRFDKIIGLDKLKAIHLNDSMNAFGSHKDRHAKIGEGKIGLVAIGRIINHSALRHLPFLLETPNELDGYKKEIEILRELYK